MRKLHSPLAKTNRMLLGSIAAALLMISGQAQAGVTNWAAYNDHVAGVVGTTTHINATTNDMRSAGGPYALKDIVDGSTIGVQMTTTTLGGTPANGGSGGVPVNGSPLYNTFNGVCYFGANVIQVTRTETNTITFTGLNPSMRYKFAAGSVRGDSTRSDRWTKCNIIGADSFVANHQQSSTSPYGIITASETTSGLTGNEVAYNSGINTAGDMIEWDDINPGSDGSFSVTSSQFYSATPVTSHGTNAGTFTPNSTSFGYALAAFVLMEYGCGGLPLDVTLPANNTAIECTPYTLTADVISGTPPFTFYWFHDSGSGYQQLSEANQSIVWNSIPASAAGNYYVIVTDSTPPDLYGPWMDQSDPMTLTVNSDTNPPAFFGTAQGYPDTQIILVSFTRPVEFSGASAFTVVPTNGIGAVSITSATLSNYTNVILTTAARSLSSGPFKVVANAGITTCNGLQVTPGSFVRVREHLGLLNFTGHNWQYNQSGTNLGTAWLANDYDDHGPGWQTGSGAFDNVAGGRTTVGTVPVNTVLFLTNPASPFPQNLPSYYFRTHLTIPPYFDPAISVFIMRYLADDGIIVYVNGIESFRTVNMVDGSNTGFTNYLGGTAVGTPSISTNVFLNPSNFWGGDNVIAVYLKQINATSADITMDLQIVTEIGIIDDWGDPWVIAPTIPNSTNVPQCGTLHLQVTPIGGRPPYNFQWFFGTNALTNSSTISGATSPRLIISNIQPADAGNYHVRVIDSAANPWTTNSADIPVTVTPETAPVLVSAMSEPDLRTIILTFDKPIAITSPTGGNFSLSPAIALTSSFVTNGNQVVLVTGTYLGENNYYVYTVKVGSGVISACTGLPASGSAGVLQQIYLAGAKLNNVWQYNEPGADLQLDWLAYHYDDHGPGWQTGSGIFDGKTPQPPGRTTVGGEAVATQLNLTNAAFPSTAAVIPSYYFRKHFTFNAEPENVSLRFRSMFDDYGVIYLNGQEAYRDTNIVATNYAFLKYVELGPTIGTPTWSQFKPFPKTNLFIGENVLAVYLKQATPGSGDITMGLELLATVTNTNVYIERKLLSITDNGATVTLSWSNGATLWYSSDLIHWTQSTTDNPQTFSKYDAQCRFFQAR